LNGDSDGGDLTNWYIRKRPRNADIAARARMGFFEAIMIKELRCSTDIH